VEEPPSSPEQGELFPDPLIGSGLDGLPDQLVGFRGPTACQVVGITYRQLDYWARTGLVAPSIRGASTLKSVSRRRSLVGRVPIPGGASSILRRNVPAITRIANQHTGIAPLSDLPIHVGGCAFYNSTMRGWTIPLGRWMDVEMRMHIFFPALALVCLGLSSGSGSGALRGIGLFFLCVAAVFVRETARLIVAAYLNLKLRAVLLLPIGGLFAYANPESQDAANNGFGEFAMALTGPIVNLITALMIAAAAIGAGGDVQLLARPLVTPDHLVRSMVWMQVGLGLLHLLPAYPLDFGRLLRGNFARVHGLTPAGRAASGLGQIIAVTVMLLGWLVVHSPWLIIAGFFIMIGAQIEDQGVFFQSVVDTVHMREVMLTDFATLSPSDTLADALVRCVHSLQEDFPVVRGPQLVGIVSRQRIVEALRNDGNGYIQGIMSRAFQVARPEDTLGTTIRRISAGHGLSLIPVTESGKVVGIVSVQNLMTSMSLLSEQRRIESEESSE